MTTTASTPSADKVHQIQATTTPEGEVKFALPIKPELVESVEAIDLDLMLTTTSGEKYILQQGALLATTNTESKLVFSNGDAMSAADQMKRMGVMKPVEGGSFRLASALIPEAADKVTGNEFGLGKDAQDTVAKIEKIIQSLESATQSSQNSESNSAQGLGKNSAFKSNADPLASAAPGTPPVVVKKEDYTNTNTNNNTNNNSGPLKVSASLLAANKDGVNFQDNALAKTEVRQLFSKSTVDLAMSKSANELVFKEGTVENQLYLSGVPTTTSLTLTIPFQLDKDGERIYKIPQNLEINGVNFLGNAIDTELGKSLKIDVTDMQNNEVALPLQWDEGSDAQSSDFQLKVAYESPTGETTVKIITFTGNTESAYTLDANGEPRLFIASKADNLVVTANDQNNNITTGSGDDTIIASIGNDKIDGGSGNNTVDYSNDAFDGLTVTLDNAAASVTKGVLVTDTLSNIQNIVGSKGNDTFKFAATDATTYTINGGSDSTRTVIDTLDYSNVTKNLTVSLAASAKSTVQGTTTSEYGKTTLGGIEQINTGSGADTFNLAASDASAVTINSGSGADTFKFAVTDATTYTINGGTNATGTNPDSVSDTLDYSNVTKDLTISLAASAKSTVQGTTTSEYGKTTFGGIEQINTGSGADTFNLAASDASAVTINSGSGADTFKFAATDATTYTIYGGTNATGTNPDSVSDTLDYSNVTKDLTISLAASAKSTVQSTNSEDYGTTTFGSIEKINTGSGADTFNLAASDASTLTINSGSGADTFKFAVTDATTYTINGGTNATGTNPDSVSDTLDYSKVTKNLTVSLAASAKSTVQGTTTSEYGKTTFGGIEQINTGSGADTFNLAASDASTLTINSGSGADTFKFGVTDATTYTINGGTNATGTNPDSVSDTLDYSKVTKNLTVSLAASAASTVQGTTTSEYGKTTFGGIEQINTGSGADTFNLAASDASAVTINSGSGADTFKFAATDATTYTIYGGTNATGTNPDSVSDTLDYSNVTKDLTISLAASAKSTVQGTTTSEYGKTTFGGIEQINTGSGADTFNLAASDASAVTINSGSGADTFKFAVTDATTYTINGGTNATGTNPDSVSDTLDYSNVTKDLTISLAASAKSTVQGTTTSEYGKTTFGGIEQINTGSGADTFNLAASDASAVTINSGSGADTFKFAATDATTYTINGGTNATDTNPDSVSDTLDYSSVTKSLTIALNATVGSSVVSSSASQYGTTKFSNVEKIIGSTQSDNISIDNNDATAYTIDGGGGSDTINGGNSHASTLSYASSNSSVQLTINNAAGNSAGGGDSDNFSNFNKFVGSSSNDTFTLRNGDTTQYTLNGGGGSDTFKVVNGSKASIDGGALADNDTIDYASVTSKVTLNVNEGAGGSNDQASASNNITFSNIKTFIGGTGGSDFTANDSDTNAYTFNGGSGTNTLNGGAGADTLVAGSGNDRLNGGSGNDTLNFHTNSISLTNVNANGGAGDDTVLINQDKLGSSITNLDGGSDTDTLVVYKGTSTAALDLRNLKATNFEILDLLTDTSATSVTLSSAGIKSLVNDGDNSILTLKLGNGVDSISIATENNVTATNYGQSYKFTDASNHLIAQVNFTYV